MSSKLEVEIEVKMSAEKMWKSLKEFTTLFPKALPDIYEGVAVLEGDGKSVGSIILIYYKPDSTSAYHTSKEMIEVVDEEKKTLSCIFLEGAILQYYKSFRAIGCIIAKDEGSIVKYTVEFVKTNEQVPNPDGFKDFAHKVFHGLDEYILNNNYEAYCSAHVI